MAIEHMVWFRFREDVEQPRREAHLEKLRAMVGRVAEIERLTAGWNFTERARGAQLGLSVTLASKAALAAYQAHPVHAQVAQGLRADCDEILALDFEH